MRIDWLDLVRFGHFTCKPINWPRTPRDFHLVVGRNEAGKSTVQAAILELLFGIERETSYGFLHPKAELCIGAVLSHDERVLELRRVRKPRSLYGAKGEPLPEDALATFLGGATRDVFRLVFGLDHERLVSGGRQILAAKNDVGKTLLQSSGNITHLRDLQQALDQEADGLWAKRRSSEREYYKAQIVLEEAEAELKRTTVKAGVWLERSEQVCELERQLAEANARFDERERERIRLERVRRVAPFLRAQAEASLALQANRDVVLLPPDAGRKLEQATAAMARAAVLRDSADRYLAEARGERAKVTLDRLTLAEAPRILALEAARQQTARHPSDIAKLEAKITTLWVTVHNLTRQLGWPDGDAVALRARLPPLPLRRTLQDLLKKQGATGEACAAAAGAVAAKQREIAENQVELAQQATVEISAELKAALDALVKLGDCEAAARREAGKVSKAQRVLCGEQSKLGIWQLPVARLQTLALPPGDLVIGLRAQVERLQVELRAATERRGELARELAAATLGIEQYRRSHHPVTRDDLGAARARRDLTWQEIRHGRVLLAQAAPEFERQVKEADDKANQRHAGAQEAAELQAKLDQLEQARLKLADAETRLDHLRAELAAPEGAWQAEAGKLGFPALPLSHYEEWRGARASVLKAAEALEQAQADAAQLAEAVTVAGGAVLRALDAVGHALARETCPAVLLQEAQGLVDAAVKGQARRDELIRQVANGRRALVELVDKADQADLAKAAWGNAWSEATRLAGLAGLDAAAVDGALTLFTQIEEGLAAIGDPEGRIKSMRRDLEDLERQAMELALTMGPDGDGFEGRSALELSMALTTRLTTARDQEREAKRLDDEIRRQREEVKAAAAKIEEERALLTPLLEAAGTTEIETLRLAITRSDLSRALTEQASQAKAAAERAGDGLTLTELEAEAAGVELARLPERLSAVKRDQDELRDRVQTLSASLSHAQTELGHITGGDDAASAATRRQGALARMAEATERYLEVRTAERLLGWAIERYREQIQEPLLARASEIFAGLTLASFARLTVDADADPPKLTGIRPGPERKAVDAEHMSDGTRDQLFLALRLAALELQIAKGHPLPFIADDLFVNFDDERARAGLQALARLSEQTQVIFLTHHQHLLPLANETFGAGVSVTIL